MKIFMNAFAAIHTGLVRVNYLDRSTTTILTGEARWFFSNFPDMQLDGAAPVLLL
jgi:hypothetical protein